MSGFSEKMCRIFLVFCVLAIFGFYQTVAAQSGRRTKKNSVSVEQNAPTESNQTNTETKTGEDQTKVKISLLKVVGEVQHNFAYYKSNDFEIAIKEFIRVLKSSAKSAPEIIKGEKMTYTEAQEQAKKENDAFTLWIGFSAKNDSYGNMYIEFVQYAVLMPQTAKVLTRGQVEPGLTQIGNPGGVIPTTRRRTVSPLTEMKLGTRQIVEILLRGGWLD